MRKPASFICLTKGVDQLQIIIKTLFSLLSTVCLIFLNFKFLDQSGFLMSVLMCESINRFSNGMRFPTITLVHPAKTRISLHIGTD